MTDRIPLDDLTSDQLDQLHDDLDRYEEVVGELNAANTGLARDLGRAEADLARYAEAESADAAAGSYALRAEGVEATLDRARQYARTEQELGNAITPDDLLAILNEDQAQAASCSPDAAETEPNNSRTTVDNPATSSGPHIYLSTGCYHGDHAYCQAMTGLNGAKRPASCKFCHSACQCPCHQQAEAAGLDTTAEDCKPEAATLKTAAANASRVEPDCCGANPPSDWIGDCWCTLPPGHECEHRCEPCTDRHGAPGWTDDPPVAS